MLCHIVVFGLECHGSVALAIWNWTLKGAVGGGEENVRRGNAGTWLTSRGTNISLFTSVIYIYAGRRGGGWRVNNEAVEAVCTQFLS